MVCYNRIIRQFYLGMLLIWLPCAVWPQSSDITVFVSPALEESGVVKFLQPRFSLKTGVKIDRQVLPQDDVIPQGADVVLTGRKLDMAVSVMAGGGKNYYAVLVRPDEKPKRFIAWLLSDIGQRAIGQFKQGGVQVFAGVANVAVAEVASSFDGNIVAGEALAYQNCGRCHVIGERNRMNGIGSTPSFSLMRSFPDWQRRFEGFFTLNPHPSFSQVIDVTEPFNPAYPPPISPLVLTLEQLTDILAFVATIPPADLGAPIVHQ